MTTAPERPNKYWDTALIWIVPYIRRGYRTPLTEQEIPRHPQIDSGDYLGAEAQRCWDEQVRLRGARASVSRVLLQLQGFELYVGIAFSIVQGLLFSVARPLLLRAIILAVQDADTSTREAASTAVIFSMVIFVEGWLQAMAKQLLSCRLGTRYIAWMSGLIHAKSTRVSPVAVSRAGLQESSLIGADVTRQVEEWRWLCLFPYVITALIGGVAVLAYILREAALVGFGIMFTIAAVNYKLTVVIKRVEEKDFALGDVRIGILREMLDGIKAIKMMAWETPFEKLITAARTEEASYIRVFRSLQVSSINSGRASPILAACFSILTLALAEPENLTAATVFVAISSFQGLRLPLISVPQHSIMLANTFVSFGRLRRYLLLDDAPPADALADDSPLAVELDNASFTWTPAPPSATPPPSSSPSAGEAEAEAEKGVERAKGTSFSPQPAPSTEVLPLRPTPVFRLHNLSLTVRSSDHLVAVVGRVASGKSSLLSAALGSMFLRQGHVRLSQRVAYIPQRPFVLSGTARENILMSHAFEERKFNRVLRASALDVDLETLPDGQYTEIGERGQTLSGGQAARLSIARALYHDAELLIVDDALSAVDPEVANSLFQRAILGFVGRDPSLGVQRGQRRSVLMTLNQLHLLPHFDHVVVMAPDGSGRIAEQGSYSKLTSDPESVLSQMLEGLEAVQDELVLGGHDKQQKEQQQQQQQQQGEADLQRHGSSSGMHSREASSLSHEFNAANAAYGGAAEEFATVPLNDDTEDDRRELSDINMPSAKAPAVAQPVVSGLAAAEAADAASKNDALNVDDDNNDDVEKGKSKSLAPTSTQHKLIETEHQEQGAVSSNIVREYTRAMGPGRLQLSFVLATTAYAFLAASDLYLASWVDRAADDQSPAQHLRDAGIYIALALGNVIGIELLSLHNARAAVNASRSLHARCISHMLRAPVGWFSAVPTGRIVSRFSGDLSMVDRQLSNVIDDVFQFFFLLAALSVVVCSIVPELIPVLLVGFAAFGWQVVAIDRTNREAKRFANVALSPILTNVAETTGARELMRCMRLEAFFRARHSAATDRYTEALYVSYTLVNFGTLLAGMVAFMLSACASLVVVFNRDAYSPAQVGLAVGHALLMPYFLSILSIVLPVAAAALTSLERLLELKSARVPQEPAWNLPRDEELQRPLLGDGKKPPGAGTGSDASSDDADVDLEKQQQTHGSAVASFAALQGQASQQEESTGWPSSGAIDFENVELRYRPDLPLALRGVTMSVRGGESIGLCGRTGSGKSTLASMALFRVHELCGGRILLDGQDISQVGLQLLRRSLTIIPQTPLLLKDGSLRRNLDPFSEHTDEELLAAMDQVGLRRELLRTPAEEDADAAAASGATAPKKKPKAGKAGPGASGKSGGGGGALALSVGERQLLSLARAILRRALKVVVLDEPTSSLDQESDEQIQRVVRTAFRGSTRLMIAHRLGSIIDSDKVAVMDTGRLVEYAHPHELLQDASGAFSGMVAQLGPKSAAQLRQRAREAKQAASNAF